MAVIAAGQGCARPQQPQRHEFTRLRMGVEARVVLYAPDPRAAEEAAAAAFHRMEELEAVFSDYRPESEASRLGQVAARGPVAVSPDMLRVLTTAQEVSRWSDGAFDVSAGRITHAWRRALQSRVLPSDNELEAARQACGYRAVHLDSGALRLHKRGIIFDFGGIAKGDAASEAVRLLKARGVTRCLVALAGDIAVGEPPPGESGWRVEVRDGLDEAGGLRFVSLCNAAISTSGMTQQRVEIAGRLYSHIIDPRTGVPVDRQVAVTVVAAEGRVADALGTALSVIEPAQRADLIAHFQGAGALVAERSASGVSRTILGRFPALEGAAERATPEAAPRTLR